MPNSNGNDLMFVLLPLLLLCVLLLQHTVSSCWICYRWLSGVDTVNPVRSHNRDTSPQKLLASSVVIITAVGNDNGVRLQGSN